MDIKPNKAEYKSEGTVNDELTIQYDSDQTDQEIIILSPTAQEGFRQCAFSTKHIDAITDILSTIKYDLPKEEVSDDSGE